MSDLATDIRRRRTFAIISHPDAGKTTLTEKLLLFSGAIQIAGSVKARKATRHATSDWMEIEKQRGISVASSVMQMEYRDCVINLLDTPGHQDFSEDTYRVLTAVDAALMVIDAANGVEPQTRRLLQVCRARNTPILTFVNKMDREVQEPLALMDEIERELGMTVVPFTWPVGMAKFFGGVLDLRKDQMRVFSPGEDRVAGTEEIVDGIANPVLAERFGDVYQQAAGEIELVREAAPAFSEEAFLAGHQTPMFFGSAVNNFGVQEVLDALVDLAPPPAEALPGAEATLASLRQLLAQATPAPRLRHLQAAAGDAIELVPVDDLVYLEAADKYVRAVTATREHWVRISLRELLPQLDPERFWQVHRSTVVQIDAVARALRQENGTVLLELRQRPEKLTVSRLHAGRFKPL